MKISSRKTSISLCRAREQQFIEESVMIDTELRKVVLNYPLLQDPVEYLSSVHIKNPSKLKLENLSAEKRELI